MCPKERHLSSRARPTTIALTPEEKLAIQLIGEVRRRHGSNRSTMNDVLVDALWDLAEKEGITRERVLGFLSVVSENEHEPKKITEMPRLRN